MTLDLAVPNTTASGVALDHEAILRSLNLNVRDPKTQAMLLICERYKIDPLMKHAVLISGNIYVTRDGYLHVAHRSGQFDGMEVLETGETPTHYTAKVAVYRKDMRHPFTYTGRFPKSERMAKTFGPEMAVKVAEVQALRRAFNVTGVAASDERWDVDPSEVVHATPARELADEAIAEGVAGYGPPPADPVTADAIEAKTTTRRRPPPSPPIDCPEACGHTASKDAMRGHLLAEHGWHRQDDGRVIRPPSPAPVPPLPSADDEPTGSTGAGNPAHPPGTREEAAATAHPTAAASPGTVSTAQVRLMHVLLGKIGVGEDDKHRYCAALIGIDPPDSLNDLSKSDGRKLIDALQAEAGEPAQ